MSADVFRGLGGVTGLRWAEAKEVSKHPPMHLLTLFPPMTKNYADQNFSCTEVERLT